MTHFKHFAVIALLSGACFFGGLKAQTPNLVYPYSSHGTRCVSNGWDTVVDCNNPSIYLKVGTSVTAQTFSHYTTERPPFRPVVPFDPSCLSNHNDYGYQYMALLTTDDVVPDSTLTASGYNRFSQSINLPFNFCFFGHVYDAFCIGEDGVLSFGRYQEGDSINLNVAPVNSILADFEDLNPYYGTQLNRDPNRGIYYNVVGEFPHRKICVTWYKVPQAGYADAAQHFASFQIVLYEGTNIIDVYIDHHYVNPTIGRDWFLALANRNGNYSQQVNGSWVNTVSIHQKAWRFVPQGDREMGLTWYQGTDTSVVTGRVIDRDIDSILVSPTTTTTYTACLRYHSCNGLDYIMAVPIVVGYDGTTNASIMGNTNVTPGESTRLMLDLSRVSGVESIRWFDGSNAQSVHVTPTTTTSYWCMVKSSNGCSEKLTHTVAVNGSDSKGLASAGTVETTFEGLTIRAASTDPVCVVDAAGRVVYRSDANHAEVLNVKVPGAGVYVVRIGDQQPRKVAVVR